MQHTENEVGQHHTIHFVRRVDERAVTQNSHLLVLHRTNVLLVYKHYADLVTADLLTPRCGECLTVNAAHLRAITIGYRAVCLEQQRPSPNHLQLTSCTVVRGQHFACLPILDGHLTGFTRLNPGQHLLRRFRGGFSGCSLIFSLLLSLLVQFTVVVIAAIIVVFNIYGTANRLGHGFVHGIVLRILNLVANLGLSSVFFTVHLVFDSLGGFPQ